MTTDNKWDKKEITLEVYQEDLLVSLRYMTLVALNRVEKAHNGNSSPMQQHLVDGNAEEALESMEEYIETLRKSCNQLEGIAALIKEEIEETSEETEEESKKRAKKTKK